MWTPCHCSTCRRVIQLGIACTSHLMIELNVIPKTHLTRVVSMGTFASIPFCRFKDFLLVQVVWLWASS